MGELTNPVFWCGLDQETQQQALLHNTTDWNEYDINMVLCLHYSSQLQVNKQYSGFTVYCGQRCEDSLPMQPNHGSISTVIYANQSVTSRFIDNSCRCLLLQANTMPIVIV